MAALLEDDIEKLAIALLKRQGYSHLPPKQQEAERASPAEVILQRRLQAALAKLNPAIPEAVREQALRQVLALTGRDLVLANEDFHQMLIEGVAEEYQKNGETVGGRIRLIDFENPLNNDLVVCDQFTVTANNTTRRPDLVLFVNGLPLAVMELKNPADENATVRKAFDQLQTYKDAIPSLFCCNGVLAASDGLEARAGALTSHWNRFMAWKTVDGKQEDPATTPQISTLVRGMLRPDVLLDLVRHFTVFEKTSGKDPKTGQTRIEPVKKMAAYHQYHAVKEAVKSTLRAAQERLAEPPPPELHGLPSVAGQPKGDRKAGVVWHTQGSGKSLSMVFYAGCLVLEPALKNPTIVVITDRNDLDDQLFDAFVAGKNLLRQEPKQAQSRAHLKRLLKTAGGGIVFSTIQKFLPEEGHENFELLSDRSNIIVIADEAHRSQYGFGAKTFFVKDGVKTNYGFAKYLRDALPQATFIGFTGTPIEKEDASTPAVFGNYIDVYDVEQAVEDGATVPIYYESRLVQVHLKEEQKEDLDAAIENLLDAGKGTAAEQAKAKMTRLEAIIGHEERRNKVVDDLLRHFEARREATEGKAMIVAASRRLAVAMYDAIVARRPDWEEAEGREGRIKVIMTSSSSDPVEWQRHATTKQERKALGERFKDPEDPLHIVIVRDMWLTGFDAPCLDAIYVDKIMRGHNLMQAIARVNRVFKDKPGGLVVDYIGIASDLQRTLLAYTKNGGTGAPAFNMEKAVEKTLEKYDVVTAMFHGFGYQQFFSTNDPEEKLRIILEAEEFILGLEDGKERFTKEVALLSKTFALAVPAPRAMEIKAEVGFFQAVKARLTKFEAEGSGKGSIEMETAIRQIVDRALAAEGVVDVFKAAGLKKPDISILSDDFLAEVQGMERKNLALEFLKKILNDEVKTRARKNLAQSRLFSERLAEAIRKYQNNLLTAAQVIDELIQLAKEIKASDGRAGDMGLSQDEVAFYDALALNESALAVMGDETLRELAQILVERVRKNTSIDWTAKESVRAKLRTIVKRLLNKYGYPPDQQKLATDNILKQAELLADEWSSEIHSTA